MVTADSLTVRTLLAKPAGFLPLLMSAAALGLVVWVLAAVGVVREPDESAAARLWQLLMAGQVPLVLVFAARWLPAAPGPAARVLGLQVGAALLAFAPIAILGG
jgi:hypothetical protein